MPPPALSWELTRADEYRAEELGPHPLTAGENHHYNLRSTAGATNDDLLLFIVGCESLFPGSPSSRSWLALH